MVDRSDPVAVVDLATAIFHGNQLAPAVSLESQAGIRFRTPTAQWSFAVGFPINTVSEVVLEIDIEVYSGAIGLGVVNANLDAYESGEVTASPGRKTVALLAERGTAPSRQLVARKISTAGLQQRRWWRTGLENRAIANSRPTDVPCAHHLLHSVVCSV